MRTRYPALALAFIASLAACSAAPTDSEAGSDVVQQQPQGGGGNQYKLTRVVSVSSPIALAMRANDNTAMYIAQQHGRVVRVRQGRSTGTVLDIRNQVSCCGEQGLLGITFSPNSNRLYVNYTNNSGDTVVSWFRMDGRKALRNSERRLLSINQPYSNHNGGDIYLNPADGLLYITTGDGGGQGDPAGNAQNKGSLLGKILRIDPTRGNPYRSPSSNPYVGRPGRDEILHYGLRNPWRFSIDPANQNMWVADVGQYNWEEVNRVGSSRRGANFGWDRMEGRHSFEGSAPANHVPPIHEYSHSRGGCAITGGHVIRDRRLDSLLGVYVFADYCDGALRTLRLNGNSWDEGSLGLSKNQIVAFGVGPSKRLFVLSHADGGKVFRLDPR
jgi:glucose/arabinose dehydrogenase